MNDTDTNEIRRPGTRPQQAVNVADRVQRDLQRHFNGPHQADRIASDTNATTPPKQRAKSGRIIYL